MGTSRRCGFVTFEDEKSMRDAIKEMHGQKNTTGFVCFVHRLDRDTDAERLAFAFCMFGEITDCQVHFMIWLLYKMSYLFISVFASKYSFFFLS